MVDGLTLREEVLPPAPVFSLRKEDGSGVSFDHSFSGRVKIGILFYPFETLGMRMSISQ